MDWNNFAWLIYRHTNQFNCTGHWLKLEPTLPYYVYIYCFKIPHGFLQVLEEAQEMAVTDFNVEYKSNLWVGKSSLCYSLQI